MLRIYTLVYTMHMYPSTRMLAHSRAPHIFSYTYPSDMTCSPPPGKVHRTFRTAPTTLFPISPVQQYSCTAGVGVCSRPCTHPYCCTSRTTAVVQLHQPYSSTAAPAVQLHQPYSCRGTLVLVVLECTRYQCVCIYMYTHMISEYTAVLLHQPVYS